MKRRRDKDSTWDTVEEFLCKEWKVLLQDKLETTEFRELKEALCQMDDHGIKIFPPKEQVWAALNFCLPGQISVVILGQDPYMFSGQAHGFCFSVPVETKSPPSLMNIFQEVKNDYPDFQIPTHGSLLGWAQQGVLLLNSILTVKQGVPLSFEGMGWERITQAVLRIVNDQNSPVAFLLWGKQAQETLSRSIPSVNSKHLVLKSGHPSPKSQQYFLKQHHFRKVNEWRKRNQMSGIRWDQTGLMTHFQPTFWAAFECFIHGTAGAAAVQTIITREGSITLGFVEDHERKVPTLEIFKIVPHPECARTGAGTRFLQKVVEWVADQKGEDSMKQIVISAATAKSRSFWTQLAEHMPRLVIDLKDAPNETLSVRISQNQ